MALENPETMQQGHDASLGCFQAKGPFYSPKYGGKFTGPSPVYRHTGSANEGGAVRTDGARNSSTLAAPNEYCQRPIPPHNYYFWSAYYPSALKEMQNQAYIMDNPFYAANHEQYIAAHNRFPCVPIQMNLQNYPQGHCFQDFQYFVVIDFEATCDKEKNPHPQEIIEFPSVLVNTGTGQLEDCFQTYVRPTCNQLLTDFCKELTGIQQPQVDKGVLLTEALLMHDKWLEEKGIKQTNFAVVTWSNWDCRVMLESECRFKRIRKPPYFNRWINLKVPFNEVFGVRCNLKEAVEMAGLTWEGRAHCGLDDAKNTARLLTHLMHRGFKFSITNSLMWQSSDYSCGVQPIPYPGRGLVYHQPHKWGPPFSLLPVQPVQANPAKEQHIYCYCGAVSIQRVVKKPGPKHGSSFFGCGNWSATRGAACPYFKWAASESEETV